MKWVTNSKNGNKWKLTHVCLLFFCMYLKLCMLDEQDFSANDADLSSGV